MLLNRTPHAVDSTSLQTVLLCSRAYAVRVQSEALPSMATRAPGHAVPAGGTPTGPAWRRNGQVTGRHIRLHWG